MPEAAEETPVVAAAEQATELQVNRRLRTMSDLQRDFWRRKTNQPAEKFTLRKDSTESGSRGDETELSSTEAEDGVSECEGMLRRLSELQREFERRRLRGSGEDLCPPAVKQSLALAAQTKVEAPPATPAAATPPARAAPKNRTEAQAPPAKKAAATAAPAMRSLQELSSQFRQKRVERSAAPAAAAAAEADTGSNEGAAAAGPRRAADAAPWNHVQETGAVVSAPPGLAAPPGLDPVGGHCGTLRKLFEGKGFGFMTPDSGAADVFLHCSDLVVAQEMVIGMRVRYTPEVDPQTGKIRARKAVVVDQCAAGAAKRSGRCYGREEMLRSFQCLQQAGKLAQVPKCLRHTYGRPRADLSDDEEEQHDDERIVAQLEARLDRESGADAKNVETFGARDAAEGWTFEAALEANERLSTFCPEPCFLPVAESAAFADFTDYGDWLLHAAQAASEAYADAAFAAPGLEYTFAQDFAQDRPAAPQVLSLELCIAPAPEPQGQADWAPEADRAETKGEESPVATVQ